MLISYNLFIQGILAYHLVKAISWLRLNKLYLADQWLWFGTMTQIDPTQLLPLVGYILNCLWFMSSRHPFLYRHRKFTPQIALLIFGGSLPLLYMANGYVVVYYTLVSMQIIINCLRLIRKPRSSIRDRLQSYYTK